MRRTNPGKIVAEHEQEQIYAALFVLIIKLRTALIVIILGGWGAEESVTVRISQFYNVVSQHGSGQRRKPALTQGKHNRCSQKALTGAELWPPAQITHGVGAARYWFNLFDFFNKEGPKRPSTHCVEEEGTSGRRGLSSHSTRRRGCPVHRY